MVSGKIYQLTQATETLTSVLAENPSLSPTDALKRLEGQYHRTVKGAGSGGLFGKLTSKLRRTSLDDEKKVQGLDRVLECGKFGQRPSDLFLQIYAEVLETLEDNPLNGFVSPPLMGSKGVMPFSIISVIPDIMQHYSDCIIAAEKEVFIATNYWEASKSATKVTDALFELSRRAVARGGPKVVVKLMYDRGNPKQVAENHQLVTEEDWTSEAVGGMKFSEVPGLELEVVNYHRPIVGTFHAKYLVVDRKVALLNSNNIQDRPNVEMMTHLEGPIVQSVYEVALISWGRAMKPPLPLISATGITDGQAEYKFGMDSRWVSKCVLDGNAGAEIAKGLMGSEDKEQTAPNSDNAPPESSPTTPSNKPFISGAYESITDHLNAKCQSTPSTLEPTASSYDIEFTPHVMHKAHSEFPIAMVNRWPHGRPGHGDTNVPQDRAWEAGLRWCKESVFIQTPTFNAKPMVEGVVAAVKRGIDCTLFLDVGFNDGGEALPFQGGTNEEVVKGMYRELKDEEKPKLKVFWYTAKDQDRPINAHVNTRNCHVKLMILDGYVGIQGSGNLDSQSYYHSQEINILIDSPLICKDWRSLIAHNQNTHLYGQVQQDGIWRDKEGNIATDASGVKSGPKGMIKGIQGSIARVQGKGGF